MGVILVAKLTAVLCNFDTRVSLMAFCFSGRRLSCMQIKCEGDRLCTYLQSTHIIVHF
jgi:hypothetical protein